MDLDIIQRERDNPIYPYHKNFGKPYMSPNFYLLSWDSNKHPCSFHEDNIIILKSIYEIILLRHSFHIRYQSIIVNPWLILSILFYWLTFQYRVIFPFIPKRLSLVENSILWSLPYETDKFRIIILKSQDQDTIFFIKSDFWISRIFSHQIISTSFDW